MIFHKISIQNFRNIAEITFSPSPGINVFFGSNGSGKTNLLEAVYFLNHGKSFKTTSRQDLLQKEKTVFTLLAEIRRNVDAPTTSIGVQGPSLKIKLNNNAVSTYKELAQEVPLRLMNSDSHQLIEGGPSIRRKFLDWGLFYLKPEFYNDWNQFQKILAQRNASLRRSLKEIKTWTDAFIEIAYKLHAHRVNYFNLIAPFILKAWSRLLHLNSFQSTFEALNILRDGWCLEYHSGWLEDLPKALETSLKKDIEKGFTESGPQRADFSIKLNDLCVKNLLSTGQQKLLVCGMILAQGEALKKEQNKPLVYLIDDLPSELDLNHQEWLLTEMISQDAQVYCTAVQWEARLKDLTKKMFHVKHGSISPN